MAIYRLSAQVVKRSEGRSATAAAAYRAGIELYDQRLGHSWDYTRKGGVLHSEILAPDNAPDWMRDRAQLWNAVERVEKRRDAQLAREIQIALPHELTHEQRVELVRDFVTTEFVAQGMIADFSVHAPDRGADDRNHHAHVMLTMRILTGDGFGGKNRDWNDSELLEAWRADWADATNRALEKYGHEVRVDHRSYADRGIDLEPEPKQGPVATEMERAGRESLAGNDRRAVQERNALRAILRQEVLAMELEGEARRERLQQDEVRRQASADGAVPSGPTEAQTEHQVARQTIRLDEMRLQEQRIQTYLADQERRAKADRKREEEQRRRESEARARESEIASAETRYSQALGPHYDIRDPYASLARAAMSEHAMFRQEQQELARNIARESDPVQRRELELRKQIEGCDYMAITCQRLAGMSRVITGRSDSDQALRDEENARAFTERAKALREERNALLNGQARQREHDKAGPKHATPTKAVNANARESETARAPSPENDPQDSSRDRSRTIRRKEADGPEIKDEISDAIAGSLAKAIARAEKSQDQQKTGSVERGSGRSRSRGGRSR